MTMYCSQLVISTKKTDQQIIKSQTPYNKIKQKESYIDMLLDGLDVMY